MKYLYLFLLAAFSIHVSGQSLSDSLLAEYQFNGNAHDTSGNGNDLLVDGAVPAPDRNGQPGAAYYFNGIDASIYKVNASAFYLNEYTYSIWVKSSGLPNVGTARTVIGVGGTIKDNGMSLNNKYGDQIVGFGVYSYKSSTQQVSYVLADGLGDTNWHHLVSTRSNDSIIFYVDGNYYGADATGDDAGYSGVNNGIYIGCRYKNSTFFKGYIDDVRIWKRALDASEVAQLYNNTATGLAPKDAENTGTAVYPNPSSNGQFTLYCENLTQGKVLVMNMLGQTVGTFPIENNSAGITVTKAGYYLIQVLDQQGNLRETLKVVSR